MTIFDGQPIPSQPALPERGLSPQEIDADRAQAIFFPIFDSLRDQAPAEPDPDCVHDYRLIMDANYVRQFVRAAYRCIHCHAWRLPTMRETLRFSMLPALPHESDEAEARAFGQWLDQQMERFQ